MKVKSQQEFKALDEELNLFEESEWDFMSVVETQEENYELFSDLEELDLFESNNNRRYTYLAYMTVFSLILICSIWLGGIIKRNSDESFENFKTVMESGEQIEYVSGDEVGGEKLIELNQVLSSYFNTLQSKSDYSNLAYLCLTDSSFEKSYRDSLSKMSSTYDEYDCRARALSEFGSYLKLNKIKKAIKSGDRYYVYCDITAPSETDVDEYIHLYSYNMTKNFMNNEVNSQNMSKFLLETMNGTPVPCTTGVFIFEFVEASDNSMRIVSDKNMLNVCDNAYESAISRMSDILGGNLSDTNK